MYTDFRLANDEARIIYWVNYRVTVKMSEGTFFLANQLACDIIPRFLSSVGA